MHTAKHMVCNSLFVGTLLASVALFMAEAGQLFPCIYPGNRDSSNNLCGRHIIGNNLLNGGVI